MRIPNVNLTPVVEVEEVVELDLLSVDAAPSAQLSAATEQPKRFRQSTKGLASLKKYG